MLRYLRLVQSECRGDGAHGAGAAAEQLHDPEAVRFGEGSEGFDHDVICDETYIRLEAYIFTNCERRPATR